MDAGAVALLIPVAAIVMGGLVRIARDLARGRRNPDVSLWIRGWRRRLLAPLGWDSALVRYCRYPSPVCGESTLNPPRMRPVGDLARLEVRSGSRTGRGALVGAGLGTLGGLLVLHTQGLSDAPRLSGSQQIMIVAVSAATWGALGALIGAASDNWETVP